MLGSQRAVFLCQALTIAHELLHFLLQLLQLELGESGFGIVVHHANID